MRPDFWFGLAITLCGFAAMTYGAWPEKKAPPEFRTLAIWGADGSTSAFGAMQWFDGVLDRKTVESIPQAMQGLRLIEVMTIEGRQVDPTWAKSVQVR